MALRQIKVRFPESVVFAWMVIKEPDTDSKTTLLNLKTKKQTCVQCKENTNFKFTCFSRLVAAKQHQTQFKNEGTILFQCKAAKKNATCVLHCKRPADTGKDPCIAFEYVKFKNTVAITIETQTSCILNLEPEYKQMAVDIYTRSTKREHLFKGAGCGFIRNAQFLFDMPFAMPGATGIYYMKPEKYPLQTWVNLVYLSCCLCGLDLDRYQKSTQQHQQNTLRILSVIALSAIGYTHHYEIETLDDTSPAWSSLGTRKDCEDFSISFVSLTNTVLQKYTSSDITTFFRNPENRLFSFLESITMAITNFIQSNFTRPGMLCGYIKAMHFDQEALEGHAWGELYDTSINQILFVECTDPCAPYIKNKQYADHNKILRSLNTESDLPGAGIAYGPTTNADTNRYKSIMCRYTQQSGEIFLKHDRAAFTGISALDLYTQSYHVEPLVSLEDARLDKPLDQQLHALDYAPDFTCHALQTTIQTIFESNSIDTLNTLKLPKDRKKTNTDFAPTVFFPSRIMQSTNPLHRPTKSNLMYDTIQLHCASGVFIY